MKERNDENMNNKRNEVRRNESEMFYKQHPKINKEARETSEMFDIEIKNIKEKISKKFDDEGEEAALHFVQNYRAFSSDILCREDLFLLFEEVIKEKELERKYLKTENKCLKQEKEKLDDKLKNKDKLMYEISKKFIENYENYQLIKKEQEFREKIQGKKIKEKNKKDEKNELIYEIAKFLVENYEEKINIEKERRIQEMKEKN